MKILTALLLSLFSAAAWAMPAVGDLSNFNGTFQGGGGGTMNFTMSLQLTAFNNSTNQFTMNTTLVLPNQTKNDVQQVSASDLLTTEQVDDAVAHCSSYGGTSETVTVPAGTFATCKVINSDKSQIWIAQVPFGIAKQISYDEDENIITLELASFVFGQ